jgi:hypothetical protein
VTVFFIFGMMSPRAAKLRHEILASAMPEGISITLADSCRARFVVAVFPKTFHKMG